MTQPQPVTIENIWRLTAKPDQLEQVARWRRKQGASLSQANDAFIKAVSRVCGQSWRGIAADLVDRQRKEVTDHLDEIVRIADKIAAVLDRVAASQRAAGGHLADGLDRVRAAKVAISVAGKRITFSPADAAGMDVVNKEVTAARDIRSNLDTTLTTAAAELRTLHADLCREAAWVAKNAKAPKEEARLARKRWLIDKIVAGTGMPQQVDDFKAALAKARTLDEAKQLIKAHGEKLWAEATARVQLGVANGKGDLTDDRPLYWSRLDMETALRDWKPGFTVSAADRKQLIDGLELSSRGVTTDSFTPGMKKILVTGFEPFGFEGPTGDIRKSNPSGAAAMALDGKIIDVQTPNGVEKYQIQAAVLPVRYKDFDNGLANKVFEPVIKGPDKVDMIVTVSQGGTNFQLEHYYGNLAGPYADNNDQKRPGQIPGLKQPGFLESTLPEAKMAQAPTSFPTIVDTGRSKTEGSGGDFLSNEVPRRVADLRNQYAPTLPTGHLHTPALTLPANPADITNSTMESERLRIIRDVEQIVRSGVKP